MKYIEFSYENSVLGYNIYMLNIPSLLITSIHIHLVSIPLLLITSLKDL